MSSFVILLTISHVHMTFTYNITYITAFFMLWGAVCSHDFCPLVPYGESVNAIQSCSKWFTFILWWNISILEEEENSSICRAWGASTLHSQWLCCHWHWAHTAESEASKNVIQPSIMVSFTPVLCSFNISKCHLWKKNYPVLKYSLESFYFNNTYTWFKFSE